MNICQVVSESKLLLFTNASINQKYLQYIYLIGLYFAWLGFYTQCLIFPSIIGILTVLYGFGTVFKFELNPVT